MFMTMPQLLALNFKITAYLLISSTTTKDSLGDNEEQKIERGKEKSRRCPWRRGDALAHIRVVM